MKAAFVGALAGLALAIGALWSCTVDRPSESLKCYSQNDCTQFAGTICESGYCIRGTLPIDARELDAFVCPAACNGGCDTSASPTVCTVTGTGSGAITCPTGMKCNITCAQAGACGPISCGTSEGCDVDCLATNACVGISCQAKNCDVTCTGANACANVTCAGGNCTQSCTGGGGSAVCGTMNCTVSGACTRTCDGAGACGSTTCGGTVACTETCSGGAAACGMMNCGNGKCSATCLGTDSACGDVSCAASCQCDVSCDGTTNACPSNMVCPDPAGPDVCVSNDALMRCNSAVDTNKCQKCP